MVPTPVGIDALPNELFMQILYPFPTRSLLPLASISHRFYDIILRLLHHRLLAAASLLDHKLILECFHPSAKLSTPGLMCDYLGTDSFDPEQIIQAGNTIGGLGKLGSLYSHFRPLEPENTRRPRRAHPAGGMPGYYPDNGAADEDIPSQTISLESHELFSQLCTIANLVKVGPKRGLFVSCVTIGEGVIRVWRDWLAEHAKSSKSQSSTAAAAAASVMPTQQDVKDESKQMLWLDHGSNVGLKLRIIEREDLGSTPILLGNDEDAPVTYTIEYDELVIRTTQLLLKVEESLVQETAHTGKAIVIGSW